MRICHITYPFPPGGGGIETHNHSLVKYLLHKGYDVDVIVVRPQSISREEVARAAETVNKGIRVHNIWYRGFPKWAIDVRRKIEKIEREGPVDVFDIHSIFDVLPFLMMMKRRTILFSLHFFELNCPGPWPDHAPRPCVHSFGKCRRCSGIRKYVRWRLVRWLAMRKVARFMVKYDYMKRLAVEAGVPGDRIEVVPHWVDVDRYQQLARADSFALAALAPTDRVVIHAARLSPEKGVLTLLEAFNRLRKAMSDVRLVLVGDGVLRREAETYCRNEHIEDKVVFVGSVEHEEVFKYLSLAHCAISCQLYDNYSWSLLDYMCAGIPIVATDVGATSDILQDGHTALFADPTAESLSAKAEQVLRDAQLGQRLAANALATVRRKHAIGNLTQYEELVHRLPK